MPNICITKIIDFKQSFHSILGGCVCIRLRGAQTAKMFRWRNTPMLDLGSKVTSQDDNNWSSQSRYSDADSIKETLS